MRRSMYSLAIGTLLCWAGFCLTGCAEQTTPVAGTTRPDVPGDSSEPAKAPHGGSPIAFDEDRGLITVDSGIDAKDRRQFWMGLGSVTVATLGHDDGQFVFDYTCEIERRVYHLSLSPSRRRGTRHHPASRRRHRPDHIVRSEPMPDRPHG